MKTLFKCEAKAEKKEPMAMTELAKRILMEKQRIVVYRIEEYWTDIGHLEDVNNANKRFKELGFI